MYRVSIVCAILSGLAACAASGPEPAAPVASAEVAGNGQSGSDSQAPAADKSESELHVIGVPDAPRAAQQTAQAGEAPQSRIVCRRIKITGSHRLTRVCQTRAEIERRREESQAAIRGIQRTPTGNKTE